MGKSSKPLRWLIHPSLEGWPEIQALKEQGHTFVSSIPAETTSPQPCPDSTRVTLSDFDVVVGPNCWRMGRETRKYLKELIDAARKLRYPKEKASE